MQPKVNKYLVVVAGPTGVGKTQVSIDLALHFNSVIISADSRQIYREMNIGTAKPSPGQLSSVKHYFIDDLSLDEPYSAGRYAVECHALLETLFKTHDVIFLTGGSGLYIRAVIEGFDKMPSVPMDIRQKWERIYVSEGLQILQDTIRRWDPEFSAGVDLKNHRRLVRALSLIETAGISITELRKQAREEIPYSVLKVFCNLARKELYARIHERVDAMLDAGLVEEVKSLLPYRETQAMQTVGYVELIDYADGKCTLDEAIMKIKQHCCNYAKRQLTWFRNQGDWVEFNPPDVDRIERYLLKAIAEEGGG